MRILKVGDSNNVEIHIMLVNAAYPKSVWETSSEGMGTLLAGVILGCYMKI